MYFVNKKVQEMVLLRVKFYEKMINYNIVEPHRINNQ